MREASAVAALEIIGRPVRWIISGDVQTRKLIMFAARVIVCSAAGLTSRWQQRQLRLRRSRSRPSRQITASLFDQPAWRSPIILTNKVWRRGHSLERRAGRAHHVARAQTPRTSSAAVRACASRATGSWDGLRFQNGYVTNSSVIQFRESSSSLADKTARCSTRLSITGAPLPPSGSTDFGVSGSATARANRGRIVISKAN